jgi:hypothetical protein
MIDGKVREINVGNSEGKLYGYKHLFEFDFCPFTHGFMFGASYGICKNRKTIRFVFGKLHKMEVDGKKEVFMNKWTSKDVSFGGYVKTPDDSKRKREVHITDIHFRENGFTISWGGNIGWGQYSVTKGKNGNYYADSECMDKTGDTTFLRELLEDFMKQIKVEG